MEWLKSFSAEYGNVASIVGLFITLLGFLFTLYKVNKSKEAADLAAKAVDDVKTDLRRIQAVDGFSSAIKSMKDIKRLQRDQSLDSLPDLYDGLCQALIAIKAKDGVLDDNDLKDIQGAVATFRSLESKIEEEIQKKNGELDVVSFNKQVSKHIDKVQALLSKLQDKVGNEK